MDFDRWLGTSQCPHYRSGVFLTLCIKADGVPIKLPSEKCILWLGTSKSCDIMFGLSLEVFLNEVSHIARLAQLHVMHLYINGWKIVCTNIQKYAQINPFSSLLTITYSFVNVAMWHISFIKIFIVYKDGIRFCIPWVIFWFRFSQANHILGEGWWVGHSYTVTLA